MTFMKMTLTVATFSAIPLLQPSGCGSNADTDQDHLGADVDNCPEQYNPSQLASDADGQGDACDVDMPVYDTTLAECYVANFSDLRGEYWKDAAMWLYQDPDGIKWVILFWTGGYPEYNIQYDNSRDIWSMLYNDQVPDWTGTWFELLATDVGVDNVVEQLEGPVSMLECTGCTTDSGWSTWYEGTMTAVRTDSSYCTGE